MVNYYVFQIPLQNYCFFSMRASTQNSHFFRVRQQNRKNQTTPLIGEGRFVPPLSPQIKICGGPI